MEIRDVDELIRLAADPNVRVNVGDDLMRSARRNLEAEAGEAESVGGPEMVRRLKRVRDVAAVLSTSDGASIRERKQMSSLAACYSDDHIRWIVASRLMTAEQLTAVNAAMTEGN